MAPKMEGLTDGVKDISSKIELLDDKKLSIDKYIDNYNSIEKTLEKYSTAFKNIHVNDLTEEELDKLESLSGDFEKIKDKFTKLKNPEDLLITKREPKNLDKITVKSGFEDIPIELNTLKETKVFSYIAINIPYEYYEVEINNTKYVMRINRDNNNEEIALLPIPNNKSSDELIQMIRISEIGRKFNDIEIEGQHGFVENWESVVGGGALSGAAGLATLKAVGSGIGNLANASRAGLTPTSIATGTLLASVTSPVWLTTGLVICGTAVAGGAVAAYTDQDFTTKDAKESGLIEKLDAIKNYTTNNQKQK